MPCLDALCSIIGAASGGQIAGVAGDWVRSAIAIGAGAAAGFIAHIVLYAVCRRVFKTRKDDVRANALRRMARPSRLLLPLLGVLFALPVAGLGTAELGVVRHGVSVALILSVMWLLIAAIGGLDDVLLARFDVSARDNLEARRVHTQTSVISRSAMIIVGVAGVGMALMTFPSVRQFGVSVLASAGIAGIVVGFAARPTLSNLIAGIQIALAQPIRLDDVVIVEGEWGRIEEITATYVVVKIWDERRLIVPLNYFIEKPFQNWTRTSADLLGTVMLWMDYTVPVEELRAELKKICESSEHWDKRVCKVQVTDASERTIQVRALVSAGDSSALWDLRCEAREKLLAYLQREHPGALPRVRVEEPGHAAASRAADS